MDYTVKDLVYYIGLFGGLAATYLFLQSQGVHGLIALLGALGVGVACGWLSESIYEKFRNRPPGPGSGPPGSPRDAPPERA
jgi:hypothetical protein